MSKYTVILLYPDYMAKDYGQETYMTCVDADDPASALAKARWEVSRSEGDSEDELINGDAFFCIAVMEGEHADVNPERQQTEEE